MWVNTKQNRKTRKRPGALRFFLIFALLFAPQTVLGDCMADSGGEIYCGGGDCIRDSAGVIFCSRHDRGGAILTIQGTAVCGRGQCAKDSSGRVFCSSEIGGAVRRDSRGRVRCYGECEQASTAECDTSVAAISDD